MNEPKRTLHTVNRKIFNDSLKDQNGNGTTHSMP